VLDDTQVYGQGVAKAFATEAKKQGITIVGTGSWDAKQPNYTALFTQIKALNPDCVYLGGIYDNNGGQVIKDKVKVLGDNTAVKLIGPDGLTGYPDEDKLAEAQGEYLTFAGLDTSSCVRPVAREPRCSTRTRPSTAPIRRPTTRCTAPRRCR